MKILHFWERYWFSEASLFNLAVVRILVVAFQLWTLHNPAYMENVLYHTTLPDYLYSPILVVRLFLLPFGSPARPDAAFLTGVYWVTVAAGFLALTGLFTNASLLAFASGNIFMNGFYYSFGDFHHPEGLVLLGLVVIAFSPAGKVLSLDAILFRRRIANWLEAKSPFAAWPLLAIQWLFALVYLSATLSKLGLGGLEWLNGYTLQYYLVSDGLRWGSDLGVFLGQNHWAALGLSWLTVLFEATFFLVLLVPRLAWIYAPMGIAFHLGIYMTMRAPFFGFMVLYSVFIPWSKVFMAAKPRLLNGGWPLVRTGR